MKPGRELDALISSRVMGDNRAQAEDASGYLFIHDQPLIVTDRGLSVMSHYSTDIAAAWLVVEKIKEEYSLTLSYEDDREGKWECYLENEDLEVSHISARSDSPAHAICLAALKILETTLP